ncbi:unnamed protein product [Nezara viridula]|uniref:Uncharacterized protein n=1 Tax=Nezara viridula TaxID=85310 RepID=A0A9P0MW06_NEZVI|nr:unnamed protein product [Nezara viridula]
MEVNLICLFSFELKYLMKLRSVIIIPRSPWLFKIKPRSLSRH